MNDLTLSNVDSGEHFVSHTDIRRSVFLDSLLERRQESRRHIQPYVKMVSPMVRYSKMPFRVLCRKYHADLAFTPMILADDVSRKSVLLPEEFTTNAEDRPLVAQFATNKAIELGLAAEKLSPYIDGIDLNCGCPQKWVISEGIGAVLSSKPQLVKDMVWEVKKRLPNMPMSIKIRLQKDMRTTVDLVQKAEAAGVEWITVHGRTPQERGHNKVHVNAISFIKSIAHVPVIANGDMFTPGDMDAVVQATKVDGIMCARGALANPAMFAQYDVVPLQCVIDYFELALEFGGLFVTHHHHLMFMLFGRISKADRREFSLLRSMVGVIDFFQKRGWWSSDAEKENDIIYTIDDKSEKKEEDVRDH